MAGWESVSIEDICDVVNGGTPKTGVPEYWGGRHRWITPAEMGKRSTPYVDETERTITDQGLQNSSARTLPPYSVILSSRAPIGHLVINTEPMATNQGCKGLIPRSRIDYKFLYHYLASIVELLNDLGTGATFKELSGGKLKEVLVPLPPLPEQRRIVAILDEAFEAIATAKANAEKNLLNAREWATGQLSSTLRTASEGGRSDTLEALVLPDCTLSYGIVQPGDDMPDGLPVVRPVDLGERMVYANGLKRIDPVLARSYARTTLKGNDLLLCVRGTTGTVGMADPALAGANVTRGIVPVRFDPRIINQTLGYYLLRSESVQEQIRAKTYGTALMQINIGDLRKIVVACPPMDKQSGLVERLDTIQETADQLIEIYRHKLAALGELKMALLHHAFSGALTARLSDIQVAEVA